MNEPTNLTVILFLAIACCQGWAFAAESVARKDATRPEHHSASTPTSYPTPEAAAQALYEAVKTHDTRSIYKVLGPGSAQLIYTGDQAADQQMRERFLTGYEHSVKFERSDEANAILLIGQNDFPFPFPLRRGANGWYFDTTAGAEEIVNRRIGENELFAIEFCLAYGDAQLEYAEQDRDGDGVIEYAQKLMSSPRKRDGLYWPTAAGERTSPLGPLAARARREGYTGNGKGTEPFHGYYYKILVGQGPEAHGGGYDYIVKGNMIGGYALLAYPALWGTSGVMSFTCNHDGVVYEKNLGAHSSEAAAKITRFNPDASWSQVK
jgi:hypothetical protein